MLKAYDIAVKKLIEVFANNIPVVGLQNDDNTDTSESVMTQVAKRSKEDKIAFPIISVFRNPEIKITDESITKRASTAEGYTRFDKKGNAVSIVAMRSTLNYTIDVFDVTRASAEEIALKLFLRLRNNPEITATFRFRDFKHEEVCHSDIRLNDTLSNIRLNDKAKAQAYKIRFSFELINANLFDLISRELPKLDYEVTVQLKGI